MNQSLTIPAGYYSNDIVVDNGVKNNGVLNWNPSGPETFTINGFYSGGTISTVNAYNAGYAAGKNDYNAYINAFKAGYDKGQAEKSGSFRFRTSYSGNKRVDCDIYINGEKKDHIYDSDGHVDHTFYY
jgi:hypothetical protein